MFSKQQGELFHIYNLYEFKNSRKEKQCHYIRIQKTIKTINIKLITLKTILFLKKDHSHSDKEIPRRRVEE